MGELIGRTSTYRRSVACPGSTLSILALLSLSIFGADPAYAEDDFSCARKGQSKHSLSVSGGFVESRFNTTIKASAPPVDFFQSIKPAYRTNKTEVTRWLLNNQALDAEILSSPSSSGLIDRYFASATHRRSMADLLSEDISPDSLNSLLPADKFSSFFSGLSTVQIEAISSGLLNSNTAEVSDFGMRLNSANQGGQSQAQMVLADLDSSPDLLHATIVDLLRLEGAEQITVARGLISDPAFIPVLLTQPDVIVGLFSEQDGLALLTASQESIDLGGRVSWDPEEEINFSLTYGYDVLSWLTLDLGYRYVGLEKGRRLAAPAGLNSELSLAFSRLRFHKLETGLEFGCYFDVWRPFVSFGLAYAHNGFRAIDSFLGRLDRNYWAFSYHYAVGLDVDLSKYVEMSIGYRVEQYPSNSTLSRQQILYTPPGASAPIELENTSVEVQQSGKVSGFFVFLRFFL